MKKLDQHQIAMIIEMLYPANKHTEANHALVNVFFNDWSIYKAEAHGDIAKNTLVKKVKRVKGMILFIEAVNASR